MKNKTIQFGLLLAAAGAALFGFWSFHTTDKKNAFDIQESLNNQQKEITNKNKNDTDYIEEKILNAKNFQKLPDFQGIKDSLKSVLENTNSYLDDYNELSAENSGLRREVQIKTDSLRQQIEINANLIQELNLRDSIISQNNFIIDSLKNEIANLRTRMAKSLELLQRAVMLETEGDKIIGFWNKKDRRYRYAEAAKIYKVIWREYGITAAEKSFYRTCKKLETIGVNINKYIELENEI